MHDTCHYWNTKQIYRPITETLTILSFGILFICSQRFSQSPHVQKIGRVLTK